MVAVIGGGIAGVATAYYLSSLSLLDDNPTSTRLPSVTLVDAAVGPAACASGKAGAFVTSSWGASFSSSSSQRGGGGGGGNTNKKQEALFRESFALHQRLADELKLESFQTVSAYSYDCDRDVDNEDPFLHPLAGHSAMVDPAELTTKLFQKTMENGEASASARTENIAVTFRQGFVEDLEITGLMSEDDGPRVTSILLRDGSTISLDDDEELVIAMGPWSSRIEDWLDVPLPLDGVVSTSLVWRGIEEEYASPLSLSSASLFAKALFCSDDDQGCHLEIFPRVHATTTNGNTKNSTVSSSSIYVSGCGGSEVWIPAVFRSPETSPDPTKDSPPNRSRAAAAQKSLRQQSLLAQHLPHSVKNRSPDVIQACIRPTTPDGMPVVGKLPGYQNVYICSGGGPWGITWGPLMGFCLAKQILCNRANTNKDTNGDEQEDSDLPVRTSPLQPSRFDTLLYRSLQQQRKSSSQQ